MIARSADILSSGVWQTLDGLENSELKRLAASLHSTVMASRAHSTASKYLYAFLRWKDWAGTFSEVVVFPVKERDFVLSAAPK